MQNKVGFKLLGLLCLAGVATLAPHVAVAQATTSQFAGTIGKVFLSSGHNEAFRITLNNNGSNALTGCVGNFAYVNVDWDNYQAYVAALTTLYVRATPINVTVTQDSNGFCQLIEFGS